MKKIPFIALIVLFLTGYQNGSKGEVLTGDIHDIDCTVSNEQLENDSCVKVEVNVDHIIASDIGNKYGINLNAGVDHDDNRTPGARSLVTAITETGCKRLRYPGGEKTNYFAWTRDHEIPDPTTNFWTSYPLDLAEKTLNFDEFIVLCKETGAIPHINVACNLKYPEIFSSELAAAWVRYANLTKGYGVKYWEIGNEMWHPDKSIEYNTFLAIVKEYSAAMKAVDPTIKVGVSWKDDLQKFITDAGSAIDFITISNYKGWENGYQEYITTDDVDLLFVDKNLRLKTVVSEFNNANWSNTNWDMANVTGKGIINFDIVGQLLKNPKVEYGCFWNTRWYKNKNGHYNENKWDALTNKNELLPILLPFKLWTNFLKDNLLDIKTSKGVIVGYASSDIDTGNVSVFIINKGRESELINMTLNSENTYMCNQIMQFRGEDEMDENPVLEELRISNNILENSQKLPSTSITVFNFVRQ
ncbi:MAG: hypothetical protein N4A71_04205 [Carboxylicivirga sp.]|jgi:alpha-L-arabinofuranosidase|nr:hypothetical protein [Carboxylicivirga sp.]